MGSSMAPRGRSTPSSAAAPARTTSSATSGSGARTRSTRPGGVVLLTTPGTWSEAFTPKDAWLGGVYRDGQPLRTLDGIRGVLGPEFELLAEEDIPLIIREHRRKYQYIVSQLTAWRRVKTAG